MKSQSFYAGAMGEHIKHCVDFRDSPSESFYSSTVKESYDLWHVAMVPKKLLINVCQ